MGASEYQASCSHPADAPALQGLTSPLPALSYPGCKDRDCGPKSQRPKNRTQELPILESDPGVKGFSDGGQSRWGGHRTPDSPGSASRSGKQNPETLQEKVHEKILRGRGKSKGAVEVPGFWPSGQSRT